MARYTLRQLAHFVAVADTGAISAAALKLHLSQGAVSAAVTELERIFKVQLMVRRKAHGVTLTPAGNISMHAQCCCLRTPRNWSSVPPAGGWNWRDRWSSAATSPWRRRCCRRCWTDSRPGIPGCGWNPWRGPRTGCRTGCSAASWTWPWPTTWISRPESLGSVELYTVPPMRCCLRGTAWPAGRGVAGGTGCGSHGAAGRAAQQPPHAVPVRAGGGGAERPVPHHRLRGHPLAGGPGPRVFRAGAASGR